MKPLSNISFKKIIIAEDSPSMRADLIEILRDLGFTNITEAQDGFEALTMMKAEAAWGTPFDILFTDINMPKMSGIVLLKEVKRLESYSKIPVFVVSTVNEKDVVIKAVAFGAADYILKPYEAEKVKAKLIKRLLAS